MADQVTHSPCQRNGPGPPATQLELRGWRAANEVHSGDAVLKYIPDLWTTEFRWQAAIGEVADADLTDSVDSVAAPGS